ncbi:hypothetical protein CAEBREN_21761 [Caenorhabditis brenneri]|uniref:Uncharacterized protein n=1 Tax=Caenorhabditis brenneri TaxID=135651 RepID=G0ND51_CAEBE|nr:hypothetical protein CAEBREN_21761 [Caenorhabditis brenneri]
MTEAAIELNKQMGGGEASVWTYHDDNKEAACEAKKGSSCQMIINISLPVTTAIRQRKCMLV